MTFVTLAVNLATGLLLGGALLPPLRCPPRARGCSGAPSTVVMSEADVLPESYRPRTLDESQLKEGQIVECAVLGKLAPTDGSRFFRGYVVDIGASKPALVPFNHVALLPNSSAVGRLRSTLNRGQGWAEVPVGAVLEGEILAVDGSSINVSFARVQRNLAWQRVEQLADLDVTVVAKVLRLTKAGASLAIEALPAFVPWSHWAVPPAERSDALVGSDLAVKFLEVDRSERRLIVSHRRVKIDDALTKLEPGSVIAGTVGALKDYGAVIKLDGGRLEGLLHVSQISQVFVKNVSACFEVDAPIYVVVLKVSEEDGSIKLSTKMLEGKPGEMLRNSSAVYERAAAAAAAEAEDVAAAEEAAS